MNKHLENTFGILEIVWVIGIVLLSVFWLVFGAVTSDHEQVRDGVILGAIFVTYATASKRRSEEL